MIATLTRFYKVDSCGLYTVQYLNYPVLRYFLHIELGMYLLTARSRKEQINETLKP